MVEGRNHHHSNRLNTTSQMIVVLSFHYHSLPRKLAKRQRISHFINVLSIIPASSGDRRTKPPLFNSSHRDGSNGGSLVLLPSFVAKIISKTSMNQLFYRHQDNRQNVYKIANFLTFCRLSRHPVVVE